MNFLNFNVPHTGNISRGPPQSKKHHIIFSSSFKTRVLNHYFLLLQETLVQNLQVERPGFCRGFRKNLGGRWRRLVNKKPTTEVYTIPAELKPQLKQIYVY